MSVAAPAQPVPALVGHYAGAVSRGIAFLLDVFLSIAIYTVAVGGGLWVLGLITDGDIDRGDIPGWLWGLGLATWLAIYFGYCWMVSGKTPGKAVVGLRIVAGDGSPLTPNHALIRLVIYPISVLLWIVMLIAVAVGLKRRALHDRVADTVVVYDWDARAARLRFLARDQQHLASG
jgi:uncharacterized RDD family membrane protein YckC